MGDRLGILGAVGHYFLNNFFIIKKLNIFERHHFYSIYFVYNDIQLYFYTVNSMLNKCETPLYQHL